jgi:hypothetical protein
MIFEPKCILSPVSDLNTGKLLIQADAHEDDDDDWRHPICFPAQILVSNLHPTSISALDPVKGFSYRLGNA